MATDPLHSYGILLDVLFCELCPLEGNNKLKSLSAGKGECFYIFNMEALPDFDELATILNCKISRKEAPLV